MGPTLGKDGAVLSTLLPNSCPISEAVSLQLKVRMSWPNAVLSGKNFNAVATFTKCDLAEKDSCYLSEARMDLALGTFPTGQLSLKSAATGFS